MRLGLSYDLEERRGVWGERRDLLQAIKGVGKKTHRTRGEQWSMGSVYSEERDKKRRAKKMGLGGGLLKGSREMKAY